MCKFESSQKMKAEHSRLIPRKHTENPELSTIKQIELAKRNIAGKLTCS